MAGSGCALHPTLQLAVGEQNWFVIALLSGAQPRPSRHTTEGWGQRGVTVVWFLVSAPPGSLSGFLLAWQKHGLGAATVAPVVHHRPSSLSCCTAPDCWCLAWSQPKQVGGWTLRGGWHRLRTAPDPAAGRGRTAPVCGCAPSRCTTQTKHNKSAIQTLVTVVCISARRTRGRTLVALCTQRKCCALFAALCNYTSHRRV